MHSSPAPDVGWLDLVAGWSEMGEMVRDFDWEATSLGALDTWSIGLRSAVAMCLSSRFPMLVVWGGELVQIYNDGYRAMLGTEKHPGALGAPAKSIWPEIWDEISPRFDQVLTTGQATYDEHQLLVLERMGFPEECFFIYSYSPLFDDDGSIGGVLDVVTETTREVVTGRRLACLSDLNRALADSEQVTDVCTRAVASLTNHGADVVAVDIHLCVDDQLQLVASNRREEPALSGPELDLVTSSGHPLVIGRELDGGPARHVGLTIGSEGGVTGVVVLSLNSQRPLDDAYRGFLGLVTGSIDNALQTAYGRAVEVGEYRRISDTLQAAMLEPASNLPSVAARYVPAVGSLAVGGDWYDVIELTDGRRALVVGDCVGHGLAAATVMAQLRSAARAMLLDGRDPAEMLEGLDSFAASIDGAFCATVVCTVIDRNERRLVYSRAGHPPPLVVGGSGVTWLDQGSGPPLGVAVAPRVLSEIGLRHDDVVVLYSDGLVERRGESLDQGLERLSDAARLLHGTGSVHFMAERLLQQLMPQQDADDIVLVVKYLPPS